ncbi:1-acyl-sn-glycerol-3-phosphate acyltransferase alpha-like [Gallus gallus]|uniref:1-acyl-sn-glycerol-3-phosphate acyltransferase n=1 Tax=Gallus gallus TaxID=9031 RepID=A0A8V1AP75_CHICK|nr:1-acyl-sn-glycerol-3-phosphate acyltransferase alpha-like [Gallus gallus]
MELLLLHYPFTFLLIAVLILCWRYPTFKYFFKMTFYQVWIFTISFLVVILALPRGRSFENIKILRTAILTVKYALGVKIVVKGKENLRTKKPCVLVLNHQNSLDVMVIMQMIPNRCVPIGKKEILYMGPFGLACWFSGIVFIDRKKREESIAVLTEMAHTMRKDNFHVLIFPEGTRNHSGSMLPFKRGAFQLAVRAQVPIVPVVISSYNSFYSQKEKRFTSGTSTIQILPPVETVGLSSDDVPKLTEQVRDSMMNAYQRISGMTNGGSHE